MTAEETESLSPAFERARAGVLLVAAQTVRRVNFVSTLLRALVEDSDSNQPEFLRL